MRAAPPGPGGQGVSHFFIFFIFPLPPPPPPLAQALAPAGWRRAGGSGGRCTRLGSARLGSRFAPPGAARPPSPPPTFLLPPPRLHLETTKAPHLAGDHVAMAAKWRWWRGWRWRRSCVMQVAWRWRRSGRGWRWRRSCVMQVAWRWRRSCVTRPAEHAARGRKKAGRFGSGGGRGPSGLS